MYCAHQNDWVNNSDFVLSYYKIIPTYNFLHFSYTYTKGGSVLNREQRDFYEKNGYILLHNLVNHRFLDELR